MRSAGQAACRVPRAQRDRPRRRRRGRPARGLSALTAVATGPATPAPATSPAPATTAAPASGFAPATSLAPGSGGAPRPPGAPATLPPVPSCLPADAPIAASEFAAAIDPLGPWGRRRAIAVAVSGGADSLCLALLAASWGAPLALVVDHGLRRESAAEAALTLDRLTAMGVPSRLLRLHGLGPGPALQRRARDARHAALGEATEAAGLADLLFGHHAADQAETIAMRSQAGSGAAGLAGMAALVHAHQIRLVRPLLGFPPSRLRATLRAAGIAWIEDPANADPRFLRARLRRDGLPPAPPPTGAGRTADEQAIAALLAARASIYPEGYARIDGAPMPAPALGALLRMIAGRAYPLPSRAVARLAAAPRPCTLGGVRVVCAGRLGEGRRGNALPGPGLVLAREPAAIAASVPAAPGALWDGRWRLTARPGAADWSGLTGLTGLTIGPAAAGPGPAKAPAAATPDGEALPALLRAGLPGLWRGATPVADGPWHFVFSPAMPACGLAFCAASGSATPGGC